MSCELNDYCKTKLLLFELNWISEIYIYTLFLIIISKFFKSINYIPLVLLYLGFQVCWYTFNPIAGEAEAEAGKFLWVPGQPELYGKFQTRVTYWDSVST